MNSAYPVHFPPVVENEVYLAIIPSLSPIAGESSGHGIPMLSTIKEKFSVSGRNCTDRQSGGTGDEYLCWLVRKAEHLIGCFVLEHGQKLRFVGLS